MLSPVRFQLTTYVCSLLLVFLANFAMMQQWTHITCCVYLHKLMAAKNVLQVQVKHSVGYWLFLRFYLCIQNNVRTFITANLLLAIISCEKLMCLLLSSGKLRCLAIRRYANGHLYRFQSRF